MNNEDILVINPGSTSTKISYFSGGKEVFKEELFHNTDLLKSLTREKEFEYRLELIKKAKIPFEKLDAVVGRGGLLHPLVSGTYEVSDGMVKDLRSEYFGMHASNFGAVLARKIADPLGIRSFIVDPVVVDELEDIARYSGIKELPRKSIFHALNHKAIAKRYCTQEGMQYDKSTLIVVHMGGGCSVGMHKNGRVIDVNNALDGEGPFSPERAGAVPVGDFFRLYYTEQFDKDFLLRRLKGAGGVVSYLETNNIKGVVDRIKTGDKEAKIVIDAMVYQIAKEIGALSTVTAGKVDAIVLTGGMAYSDYIVDGIKERVGFIAKVGVIPGENEMQSLYEGAKRVLDGVEEVKTYE